MVALNFLTQYFLYFLTQYLLYFLTQYLLYFFHKGWFGNKDLGFRIPRSLLDLGKILDPYWHPKMALF